MRLPLLVILLASSRIFGQSPISIPLGGNAWSNHPDDTLHGRITNDGIVGWDDPSTSFTVWFRLSAPGTLDISLLASVPSGSSTISISLGGGDAMAHTLTLKGSRMHNCPAGPWTIRDTGYHVIEIRGLQRSGPLYANIQSLSLSGPATASPLAFVPDNSGNFFYWGRRGPSVHLNYAVPEASAAGSSTPAPARSPAPAGSSTPTPLAIEYFYNEVTVPPDQDIIGSYFMADGFNNGYFGMQVNSATERRILFSVWSPFVTDDPKAIPDSLRVRLVNKGPGVHAGSFGDEGSGGQSYLVYPWVAGSTYRFLLRAQPMQSSSAPASPASTSAAPASPTSPTAVPASSFTRYTAWFFAPEKGKWRLIASWDRPATRSWLQHLHSFLENFDPDYGDQGRRAAFTNQWVRNPSGRWIPLTRARFTGDNTARKGYRLDYAGGVLTDGFYLRNGGFFSTPTPLDKWFERPLSQPSPPDIDLPALP